MRYSIAMVEGDRGLWMMLLPWLICLSACATNAETETERLMTQIESSVVLPSNAFELEEYARYYTFYRGKVHGAYTMEVASPLSADEVCEQENIDGSTRPVKCPDAADLPLGERRWVKFEDYPAVSGSDCMAIQLEYDPRNMRFDYIECAAPLH